MISFNDLKNNIEIMKTCLKDMKFFQQKEKNIKASFIQEEILRKNFPQLFLEILHYVLIEYSYELFTQILQQCPTIRTDNDMPFIQHAILISRNLLKIDVKIDANQFFNLNKFFEKKVELVSKICKGVHEFQMSRTKGTVMNGNFLNANKSKPFSKNQVNKNPKTIKNYIDQDDQEQDMPRNINVAPTKLQPSVTSFNYNSHLNSNKLQNHNNSNSDSDQQLKLLREKKNKIQNIAQKPKQIIKKQQQKQQKQQLMLMEKKTVTRLNRNMELTKQQQPEKYKQHTQKVYFNAENPQNHKEESKSQQQEQQSQEYMTRKEVLQIMSLLNTNISKLITNFNDFQKDVGSWMNNINAKVSLLQENVKTIRNNL